MISVGSQVGPSAVAHAENYQGTVCTGFNPERNNWAMVHVSLNSCSGEVETCPKGYAIMGVLTQGGKPPDGSYIGMEGTCCKLPDDALLDEHTYAPIECPAGYVATGGRVATMLADGRTFANPSNCSVYRHLVQFEMRCTKVNDARYLLRDSGGAVEWGWGIHFSTMFEPRVNKLAIPASLRYGLGRLRRASWKLDGCVGKPFGSLFYRKESKYCSGMHFRQLLYKDTATPVTTIKNCPHLSNPLDGNAECLESQL